LLKGKWREKRGTTRVNKGREKEEQHSKEKLQATEKRNGRKYKGNEDGSRK
jgi:hypothetical protein